MMRPSLHSNYFILQAFDRDLWCPIAQTRFHVGDIGALRSILDVAPGEDPELRGIYTLDDAELTALTARFGVKIDPSLLGSANLEIGLFRWHGLSAPYLIHTGYELPLLLDGRKKLACMSHAYPPTTFDGEHRFDHWVAEGLLHREEFIEPIDPRLREYQLGEFLGQRTVYYTPKGEEWRIPAMRLIWYASGKSGGWNEYFERLEGMLFGYEDWQNDWWIDRGLQQRGGFGGAIYCCPITLAGLAWMETAGFRALPPVESPTLLIASYTIASYDADAKAELHALMFENPDTAAVVRFNVSGWDMRHFIDLKQAGPSHVSAKRISELNRYLRRAVVIVARRDPVSSDATSSGD
jgi:hypothetical protein